VKLSALIALALLSGCATKAGRWYPVIGFGWVVVNTNQLTITASKVLGLNTGSGQMSLGFSSLTVVKVPTNANVIIDLQ